MKLHMYVHLMHKLFSEMFSVSPLSITQDILWGRKQCLSILSLTAFGKRGENQDKKCDPKISTCIKSSIYCPGYQACTINFKLSSHRTLS